jgi:hypothetical protein
MQFRGGQDPVELTSFPEPNEALTALLISPRMQAIVLERAEFAKATYQAQVAKRSGALAASAHAHTEIGGVRHDRHVGILTVGEGLAYGAAHEFGVGDHPMSVHNLGGPNVIHPAAHDLNRVLEELGGT